MTRIQDANFSLPLDGLGILSKNAKGKLVVQPSAEVEAVKSTAAAGRRDAFNALREAVSADDAVKAAAGKLDAARESLSGFHGNIETRLKAGMGGEKALSDAVTAAEKEFKNARSAALKRVTEPLKTYRTAHAELSNVRAATLDGQAKAIRQFIDDTPKFQKGFQAVRFGELRRFSSGLEEQAKHFSPSKQLIRAVESGKTSLLGATNAASVGWIRQNPIKSSAIAAGAVVGGVMLYNALSSRKDEGQGFAEAEMQRRAAAQGQAQGAVR